MCPKRFSAQKKESKSVQPSTTKGVCNVLQYEPPVYRENPKGCYIEFRAFDPDQGKLRRKRMKVNRINGVLARRKYAKEVISRLTEELRNGWNRWAFQVAVDGYDMSGHKKAR